MTKPPTTTDAELASAGVAENETRPDVLLPLAGRSIDCDRAIVVRLAREPSTDRAEALRALATAAEERGWKTVAKDVRRALYRFEQRGVDVPPRPPTAPRARRLPATTTLEGYLSPIDGRGDRLVWLVRPRRTGGLLVMTGVLNEPGGLRDIAVAEMPRKILRRMSEDMRTKHKLRMVRADGAYVDALLFAGFARARTAGTTGVGEYPVQRARMVTGDPCPLEPPLICRIVMDEPESETSAHVTTLLVQPELATWSFEHTTLAPYLEEIREVRDSPLVLSPTQQQDRVRDIVARALRELCSGDMAVAYRRRLEEMAYYFHATGRADGATAACASAAAIARANDGEGVLFLETLMEQSFALLTAQETARAQEEEASSLIVKPSALRARQRAQRPGIPPRRPC